jgi:hypothetical protein
MSSYWEELNKYDETSSNTNSFELIPHGTLAKVRMTIKPGGYNDESQGWTGGYATRNPDTGSICLEAEFVILEGQYAKRKVWSSIGLHSQNGPGWGNMGMAFIRSIINSAKGLSTKDNSETAILTRSINGFASLNGLEFVARINTSINKHGEMKNEIKMAITPDHKDYVAIMNGNNRPQIQNKQNTQRSINNSNHPAWA